MTILLPPWAPGPHVCVTPDTSQQLPLSHRVPMCPEGTLWECPKCGRWWSYHYTDDCWDYYEWRPVRWYDVPSRRRIATHETEKHGTPTRWWHCHPNPKRGQP